MAAYKKVLGADIGQRVVVGVLLGVVAALMFPLAPVKYVLIPLVWYVISYEIMGMWANRPTWRALLEWTTVTFGLLVALALLETSPKWAFVLIIGAVFTDVMALFAGRIAKWCLRRYLGRSTHQFSVHSPKKTWEGVIGGIVGSVACSILAIYALGLGLPAQAVALIWLIPFVAIYGDLFESKLKRETGTKDSSKLLGPHGGVLDRLDSVGPVFATSGFAILVMVNIGWLY